MEGTSLAAYVFKLLRVLAWAKSAALIKIKEPCCLKIKVQENRSKQKQATGFFVCAKNFFQENMQSGDCRILNGTSLVIHCGGSS